MRSLNDLIFDEQSISDLGVTVSQKNVLDSPQRDVKVYEVPGRNGNIIVDNGRYKNATVTYHVNITEDMDTKAEEIRDFLRGVNGDGYYNYKILRDTYNPEEYRHAVYSGDIKFDVGVLLHTGECDLTFNCKPQRFLDSGVEPIQITNIGDGKFTIMDYDDAYADCDKKTSGNLFPTAGQIMHGLENNYLVRVEYTTEQKGKIIAYLDDPVKDDGNKFPSPRITGRNGQPGTEESYFDSVGSIITVPISQKVNKGWLYFSSNDPYYETVSSDSKLLMYVPFVPGIKLVFREETGSEIELLNLSGYGFIDIENKTREVSFPVFNFTFDTVMSGYILLSDKYTVYVDIDEKALEILNGRPLEIDTETMDACVAGQSMNKYVYFSGDIKLNPGINSMYIGKCKSVSFTPRWYKI